MTNVVTYYSGNTPNPNEAWSAYVILPTGKRWGVVAFGETEQQAINKIVSLYEAEAAKFVNKAIAVAAKPLVNAIPQSYDNRGRGHHFAGKVWMIHSFTRAKQRINPDEVAKYEAEGWVKGGPRSK